VLCHPHAGAGHDKGSRGRDVEGIAAVAPGATGIYERLLGLIDIYPLPEVSNGLCEADQLVDRFTFVLKNLSSSTISSVFASPDSIVCISP